MANSADRRFTAALWALRLTAAVSAVLAVLQPVWIGQYMSGVFSMIGVHSSLGGVLEAMIILVGICGLLYALAGGRVVVVGVTMVLFVATGMQIGMGFSGTLWVHVPLGVLLAVVIVLLSIWTWTAGAERRRPPRRRHRKNPAAPEGVPAAAPDPASGRIPERPDSSGTAW